MHIEFLVEDASGARLIEILLPKIIGPYADPHSWRIISYKGLGRIPPKLKPNIDPAKRVLLDTLPRVLAGYAKNPAINMVVIVIDADKRNCRSFLDELGDLGERTPSPPKVLFRLAIEEIEAWYFGDREAVLTSYPRARSVVLSKYVQDSVCGTWEMLADAVHPGGSQALKAAGSYGAGEAKFDWAERIGPEMKPERNTSPSFCKFRDGLANAVGAPQSAVPVV